MTLLLALFARWGVPERFRAALGWALASIVVLALLWVAVSAYDRRVIERHEAKVTQRETKALDDAAEQRAMDAVINLTNEKDREDAINAAPTGAVLSDPERALGCERLRKLGRHPPACQGY